MDFLTKNGVRLSESWGVDLPYLLAEMNSHVVDIDAAMKKLFPSLNNHCDDWGKMGEEMIRKSMEKACANQKLNEMNHVSSGEEVSESFSESTRIEEAQGEEGSESFPCESSYDSDGGGVAEAVPTRLFAKDDEVGPFTPTVSIGCSSVVSTPIGSMLPTISVDEQEADRSSFASNDDDAASIDMNASVSTTSPSDSVPDCPVRLEVALLNSEAARLSSHIRKTRETNTAFLNALNSMNPSAMDDFCYLLGRLILALHL